MKRLIPGSVAGIATFALALACGKSADDTTATKPTPAPAATSRAAVATPAAVSAATTPAMAAPVKVSGTPTPASTTSTAAAGAGLPDGASLDLDRRTHMTTVRAQLQKRLGPTYNAPIPKTDANQTKTGGELFAQNCVSCHGDGGKGDGPTSQMFDPRPADLTNLVEATFYSDAAQMEIIKGGIAGSAMPAWDGKLTGEEILQVFNFVRSLRDAAAAK